MTSTALDPAPAFGPIAVLDLDAEGYYLDAGTRVDNDRVESFIERKVAIPAGTTDIFVYVHGWRTPPQAALARAQTIFNGIESEFALRPQAYPSIKKMNGFYVVVRWPSQSSPLRRGYRAIRDRAHAMTTSGQAEYVLSALLGYLNSEREDPEASGGVLRTVGGQYLHLIGHSFGGRFLAQAVLAAANPTGVLKRKPFNPKYPYTVDNLIVFQMAARSDIFAGPLAAVLDDSPVQGPITLTFSSKDRATCQWHWAAEGVVGIGCHGATEPASDIVTRTLHRLDEPYTDEDFDRAFVNIDAGWLYRHAGLSASGAHSDFLYRESIQLLLSLLDLARRS